MDVFISNINVGAVESGKAKRDGGRRAAVQGNWRQMRRSNIPSSSLPHQHAGRSQIGRNGSKGHKGVRIQLQGRDFDVLFTALSEGAVSHNEGAVIWFYNRGRALSAELRARSSPQPRQWEQCWCGGNNCDYSWDCLAPTHQSAQNKTQRGLLVWGKLHQVTETLQQGRKFSAPITALPLFLFLRNNCLLLFVLTLTFCLPLLHQEHNKIAFISWFTTLLRCTFTEPRHQAIIYHPRVFFPTFSLLLCLRERWLENKNSI